MKRGKYEESGSISHVSAEYEGMRIRTPYEETEVYQNGVFVKIVNGKNSLLTLETKENDVIVLQDKE